MLRLPEMPAVQYEIVALTGGLDQVTSSYQLAPGALRDCINYACRTDGGYYRIPGYERFDGRQEPHTASFVPIGVAMNSGETLSVGDAGLFGNVSGTVCYVDPFGEYVGLTKTGHVTPDSFVAGPIVISSVTVGSATSYYTNLDIKALAVNRAAAANIYRADIGAVPGSGPIRGVAYLNDEAYAFRDNTGATACVLHKSSASGWQVVQLGETLNFSAMSVKPADGATITKSGVSATVKRTVITEGDLTAGTAEGYFVISGRSGGVFTAGSASYPGGSSTLGGASAQIQLSPGGKYSLCIERFSAGAGVESIYGADGVNDPFEFDGVTYVPLPLIGVAQKPISVIGHANHLFFMVGSSVVTSAIGDPYNQEVINGASEIALKGIGTGMLVLPGNQGTAALGVFTADTTSVLYGTSSADWHLASFNIGIGAKEGSLQNLFDAFAFDERGMTMLKQSLNYGNFDSSRLTYNIRPFVTGRIGEQVCSGLNRENGQYRIFFSDGYGIYTTVTPKGVVGHGVVLFPHPVLCSFDGESSDGQSVTLFGTGDGYVMRNDVGTSFDGTQISAFLNTNINAAKSPRTRKRFRKLVLELQGTTHVEMQVGYSFEWSSPTILPHDFNNVGLAFSVTQNWDEMIWDSFFWDGRSTDAVTVDLQGTGENIQLAIVSESDYVGEFTIPSAIFHYTPRRGNR